ncbi:MAG: ferredoxin/flavodoxin---NADP+ reductase [Solirubrobacterales bacterium]|nr:ferredoxin/flavodoxin---NADP+ reductase [Solirubrobacterales bacterium]
MTGLGTPENPLRVAIVGSGPAGFYAAEHLLKRDDVTVAVDMFDRLPTPFGLVRAGVAPDHPKIKSVIRMYEKTAAREGYQFFGNVDIGTDVTVAELEQRYHAVISAYGTATDRQLGIPGEDLPGSHAATEFVNWYNAHPDFADHDFDLSAKRAVVIGNGNVAADVARMLALPRAELDVTDTADHAIESLSESAVEEIVVLGRRGPAQAAFTNPEVRELGELTDADIIIDPAEMELDEASRAYFESDDCDPTHRRNVEIFTEFSQRAPEGKPKRVVMRFCSSPIEIRGDGKVESIVIGRNELYSDDSGAIRARDTGEREELECGLVLRSIGYKGVGLEGLPFDPGRGVIPNDSGRVTDPDSGEQVPGHYVVGWIKRGPSGVIGTNKKDAADTVASIFEDLEAGAIPDLQPNPRTPAAEGEDVAGVIPEDVAGVIPIAELLDERGGDHVTYMGWQAIDRAEQAAGEPHGRPRVKFCRVHEMVEAAREAAPAG